MKLSFPVDGGSYESDSLGLSFSERINLYPSIPQEPGGSARGGLFTFPGLGDELASYTALGKVLHKGELYLSSGGDFVKLPSHMYGEVLGSLNTSAPVQMASNGEVICILNPGSKAWFYDDEDGLVEIVDPTFLSWMATDDGVESVCFIDGFFLFSTRSLVFKSSLVTENKGRNFDALDFVRPFLTEKTLKVMNVRGELCVEGENQTKFYSNVGGADFPFQEIPSATVERGLLFDSAAAVGGSARCSCVFDDSYFFIGGGVNETIGVYRGQGGGSLAKISTDFIDREMEDRFSEFDNFAIYPEIGGFSLFGKPYVWIRITYPSSEIGDVIYLYDILYSAQTGSPRWIQIKMSRLAGSSIRFDPFEAYGKILNLGYGIRMFDRNTYGFGQPDLDASPSFSSQYLQAQSDPLIVNRLELVMDTGVGESETLFENAKSPAVELLVSDDGARTFNSLGSQSVGKSGRYGTRLVWPMLGLSPQSRIFKFVATTGVPLRFHRIDMEVEKGFLYG